MVTVDEVPEAVVVDLNMLPSEVLSTLFNTGDLDEATVAVAELSGTLQIFPIFKAFS